MLKYITKSLTILLFIVSAVSLLNVLVMYWLPIDIPISSFSAVRLTVVAFIEKKYYLILVSVLICILLFLSTLSVRRQRIILPSLSLLYLIYDFGIVLSLFADGLYDGYWRTYIVRIIVSIVPVVLLCIYCWNVLNNRTGDG